MQTVATFCRRKRQRRNHRRMSSPTFVGILKQYSSGITISINSITSKLLALVSDPDRKSMTVAKYETQREQGGRKMFR